MKKKCIKMAKHNKICLRQFGEMAKMTNMENID